MLKHVITGLGVCLLLAVPFSSAQAALLAKIEADVDGSGEKKVVELTGDKKIPGSNYYADLWILVRDADGKMETAWKADLDGGYYCLLEKLPVNRKEEKADKKELKKVKKQEKDAARYEEELAALLKEMKEDGAASKGNSKVKAPAKITEKPHDQILLLAAKGGKNAAVGCRILDFSDKRQVMEVFSGADALGIAAKAEYKPDFTFSVACSLPDKDGNDVVTSFSGKAENMQHLYHEDGSIAKPYLRPQVTEVTSLTRLGGRLFTEQNILGVNRQDLLGRLSVRWVQKNGTWVPEEANLIDSKDELMENDTANQADGAGNWKIYPRRAFIGDRIISRPVVAVEEKPELQNRINKTLEDWFAKAPEEDERAFQVKFAGPNLLSLELGWRNRKGEVVRDLYNINMQDGKNLKLEDMFNTKNPDFIRVLNLTGRPRNAFLAAKPVFWHYTGKYYVLQDRLLAENFQDEEAIHMATVEAENLAAFLKDKTVTEK